MKVKKAGVPKVVREAVERTPALRRSIRRKLVIRVVRRRRR